MKHNEHATKADLPRHTKRSALDAATELFTCRCDKPECVIRTLVPFRDHVARLFNAIGECEGEGLLRPFTAADGSTHTWHAVAYHLQMAAALDDVEANTAYTDLLNSWLMCGSAADFDDAHSLVAARYFAGAIIFNFVWSAYEAAIRVAATTQFARNTTAIRGIKLAQVIEQDGVAIPALPKLMRGAERFCQLGGGLDSEISNSKVLGIRPLGAKAAAELGRILRNQIAHGRDEVPLPSDWGSQALETGRIYRLYAVARGLVMLIQLFAIHCLTEPARAIYCSWNDGNENDRTAVEVLTDLHV